MTAVHAGMMVAFYVGYFQPLLKHWYANGFEGRIIMRALLAQPSQLNASATARTAFHIAKPPLSPSDATLPVDSLR
jgi:hypothetical protein